MIVLGIESSCDETAIAIVNSDGVVMSHKIVSQIDTHQVFGGVVPEIASRAHAEVIDTLILEALKESKLNLSSIAGFAGVCGPGLLGGLIVGALSAKLLAASYKRPFLAINHLHAHCLLPVINNLDMQYPFLCLLVSGGHTQFVLVRSQMHLSVLGETIDDAIGEAFDKSARVLGLPYPGGSYIEELAKGGEHLRYKLPRPLYNKKGCDLSFSGLKAAFSRIANAEGFSVDDRSDLCASLQYTIKEILINKVGYALEIFFKIYNAYPRHFVISGGVAANLYLREQLSIFLEDYKVQLIAPPLELCTDNGVMVAWAGVIKLQLGYDDPLDFPIRSNWPLSDIM